MGAPLGGLASPGTARTAAVNPSPAVAAPRRHVPPACFVETGLALPAADWAKSAAPLRPTPMPASQAPFARPPLPVTVYARSAVAQGKAVAPATPATVGAASPTVVWRTAVTVSSTPSTTGSVRTAAAVAATSINPAARSSPTGRQVRARRPISPAQPNSTTKARPRAAA
jgi:hypothetical protein